MKKEKGRISYYLPYVGFVGAYNPLHSFILLPKDLGYDLMGLLG